MGGDALHNVLLHLLARAQAPADDTATDASLLERFATHGDEAAFEALVRRHGPLVLDVCRGVLHNAADADDAFQATFLVLARKAGAIRKHASVGSWLHGVAYRIAMNVRGRAARQRARERQAADMPRPEETDELDRQELRQLLGEELEHLAQEYRAALVLFYLEGKTYEETARALQCPVGTVRSRLARGRKALRSRLAGRGLSLPATGRTPVVPGGIPDALVAATVKTALTDGACTSARVLALAEEALRGLALGKVKCTLAVLLVVGMLAGAAGLLASRDRPPADVGKRPNRAVPSLPVRAETPAAPRLDVAGRVLDTAGQPVTDATVHLREWTVWQGGDLATDIPATDILATARTDARGAFAFHGVNARPFSLAWQVMQHPWDLVVLAPGRALAWRHLTPQARQSGPLTFHLGRAAAVRGRLTDTAGRPVAGAVVRAIALLPLADGATAGRPGTLRLSHSQLLLQTRSDTAGRFTLDGLPHQMRVHLDISSTTHRGRMVQAATTDEPQPNLVTESPPNINGKQFLWLDPVLSGEWTVALEPGRRVRGRVIAADTGRPVPGARLRAGVVTATADDQGRFTLGPLPLAHCVICARGPDGGDFLGVSGQLSPSPVGEEPELTMQLSRGISVTGQVVDEDTSQGVARAHVRYQSGGKRPGAIGGLYVQGQTNAEGRFRLVVPPGTGKLLVHGAGSGYHEPRAQDLDLRFGRAPTGLVFALRRGLVVRGRIRGPEGRRVKGAQVKLAHETMPNHPLWACVSGEDGTFTLTGLPAGPGYEWVVAHPSQPLGACLAQTLPRPGTKPFRVEFRLAPLASVAGRVLDARRSVLAGATVRVVNVLRLPGRPEDEEVEVAALTTDHRGQFQFDRLLPSARRRYRVEALAQGYVGRRALVRKMQHGQRQVLPDLLLPPATSVSGTVLGPQGQPLPDVRVRARAGAASSGASLLSPVPVVTGRDGRFCLTGVPAGPLEVEAEQCVPGEHEPSKRPRCTTTVQVQAGGHDARVVLRLDPSPR
jgi:RNA polymerase sigma factor (sigma-70 family)